MKASASLISEPCFSTKCSVWELEGRRKTDVPEERHAEDGHIAVLGAREASRGVAVARAETLDVVVAVVAVLAIRLGDGRRGRQGQGQSGEEEVGELHLFFLILGFFLA